MPVFKQIDSSPRPIPIGNSTAFYQSVCCQVSAPAPRKTKFAHLMDTTQLQSRSDGRLSHVKSDVLAIEVIA